MNKVLTELKTYSNENFSFNVVLNYNTTLKHILNKTHINVCK